MRGDLELPASCLDLGENQRSGDWRLAPGCLTLDESMLPKYGIPAGVNRIHCEALQSMIEMLDLLLSNEATGIKIIAAHGGGGFVTQQIVQWSISLKRHIYIGLCGMDAWMVVNKKRVRSNTVKKAVQRASKQHLPQSTKAKLILRYARDSAKSLLDVCDQSRAARRESGGAITHAEQDFLRAMIVFAASGLDSLLKYLIRDSLADLARKDKAVQKELEKFVERQLRGGATESSETPAGAKFLSRILADPKPPGRLVEEYIHVLTGSSLQSEEQLFRSASALGLSRSDAGLDRNDLHEIFDARNQIIHELDIRLTGNRARRTRRRDPMKDYADALLDIGEKFIAAVERKLKSSA